VRFADVRALRTEIAAVTAEMVSKRLDPQSVVVTQEQARALVMVEGAEELRVAGRRLLVVSELEVGQPLPDGMFQVLEGIPEVRS